MTALERLPRPELLSPAGDMERLRAAVAFGADAVYLSGKSFGMRSAPANFGPEELREAVEYCHRRGVKVYVACNTLPRNEELTVLPDFLRQCAAAGADAFIVSDLGVLSLCKKYAPHVALHISTQTGIVNYAAARTCAELGAQRVILAREVPLGEIRGIRANTPESLTLEAFVHGAMCVSFSGRCLLSNYMTGRDSNRGECAQPCRWEYTLIEKERPDRAFTLLQEEKGAYVFNSNDLCMISHLPALIRAGVGSFKIEGRAKSAYYVATVTAAYRRAIDFFLEHPDDPLPEDILAETEKISHRAYSTGFYFGGEPGQTTDRSQYTRKYELAAIAQGREGGYVRLTQRNRFFQGDTVDVLQPGMPPFTAPLEHLFDQDLSPISSAPHAEMTVLWKTDAPVQPGAFLRICRS